MVLEKQLWLQAEALLRNEQLYPAETIYRQLSLSREFAPLAFLRLSLVAQKQGDLRLAVKEARSAFDARDKKDVEILEMIAKRMIRLCDFEAVSICVEDILESRHIPPGTAAELAKLLTDIFMPDLALKLLVRAKAGGLRTPAVDYLHGLALTHLGDLENAQVQFMRAIEHDPTLAQAHWMLSKLKMTKIKSNHIESMERLMGHARGQDAALLGYALFKQYDDLGEVDKAWTHLDRAMQIRKSNVRHDKALEQRMFESLMRGQWHRTGQYSPPDSRPIFIVGLPRSGTTLLETLLGRHDAVAVSGELHDAVFQLRWVCNLPGGFQLDESLAAASQAADMGEYGRRYLQQTRWRATGKKFFTDKMPSNFMLVGPLLTAIPDAVVLHVSRDPVDVCFSNLREIFAAPYTYSYDQSDMAEHYCHYRNLMDRWKGLFPEKILDIKYEALVADTKGVMKKVVAFCGLAGGDDVMRTGEYAGAVSTASAVQVREAVHTRFIGRSKQYQRYLTPLIQGIEHGLGMPMERLNG